MSLRVYELALRLWRWYMDALRDAIRFWRSGEWGL